MGKTYFPDQLSTVFDEIQLRIRETLNPEYILLAGSFAKGSWLYHKDQLLSDIEIVFVCESKWSTQGKRELVEELNNKFGFKIELKGFIKSRIEKKILSNYSWSNPGYLSLNFYDVFSEPKYLFKIDDVGLNVSLKTGDIPAWEAWRLIVNRMSDLLKAQYDNPNRQEVDYYWMKMLESVGDSYLIVNDKYSKTIQSRLENFSKDMLERDPELEGICKSSWEVIHNAYQSRISHDLDVFDPGIASGELKIIVNSWMNYFEQKMAGEEGINYKDKLDFYKQYLANGKLQQKYLDVTNGFNIVLSNAIKLSINRKLIKTGFKWTSLRKSWRHHILVIMAILFYEEGSNETRHDKTRQLSKLIFDSDCVDQLDSKEFTKEMIRHWQMVR